MRLQNCDGHQRATEAILQLGFGAAGNTAGVLLSLVTVIFVICYFIFVLRKREIARQRAAKAAVFSLVLSFIFFQYAGVISNLYKPRCLKADAYESR